MLSNSKAAQDLILTYVAGFLYLIGMIAIFILASRSKTRNSRPRKRKLTE